MGPLLLGLSLLLSHLITQLIVHLITKKLPNTPTLDVLYAANWLVSLVHAVITTLVGVVMFMGCEMELMEVKVPLLYPYGWLSLGYWVYDLLSLAFLANKATLPNKQGWILQEVSRQISNLVRWWPGMVGHHLGVITFLCMAVINTDRQRGDGMVVVALIMEISSVFVAARSALARLGFKKTSLYLWISICMVASFFLGRIVLIPGIILLYSKQQGLSLVQGILTMPKKCAVGTLMFYGLNCYWFGLMVKGSIKVLRKPKKS